MRRATPRSSRTSRACWSAHLDYDAAATKFADIVKKHPDFIPAKINLARINAVQGKMADAELLLSATPGQQSRSEPALSLLAKQ